MLEMQIADNAVEVSGEYLVAVNKDEMIMIHYSSRIAADAARIINDSMATLVDDSTS